jgi:CheY-like chemotaxis protein
MPEAATREFKGLDMERQLKVIVLDVSMTSRKILEVIISREGHLVACFSDPLEALRFLCQHGPADLLFLGMELPKMDGFGVLKYLRGEPRFRSMVPIALLSSRNGILYSVRARLAGAQRVVQKPLVRMQIVSLVSEYPRRGNTCSRAVRLTLSHSWRRR